MARRRSTDANSLNSITSLQQCNALQHTATHCNKIKTLMAHRRSTEANLMNMITSLQQCNALQHTATKWKPWWRAGGRRMQIPCLAALPTAICQVVCLSATCVSRCVCRCVCVGVCVSQCVCRGVSWVCVGVCVSGCVSWCVCRWVPRSGVVEYGRKSYVCAIVHAHIHTCTYTCMHTHSWRQHHSSWSTPHHVTHTNESCHTYGWVMLHVCIRDARGGYDK